MLGGYRSGASVTGDLLLVISVVTLVPSWIGAVELLSAFGVGNVPAAAVSGVYVWGRGGLSAALLLRRWRQGTLTLTRSWLAESLEAAAAMSPMADYPTPAPYSLSVSTGASAVPA
ncbi:hypothetical protein [Halolamina salifodinae]|uniref:Uncharacterized protein n=1 Tax=Halolamina salifodinae TaxID=1202767 RepID=A0A8T4GYC2_9EURY|nr:hypothetical protein [Halolamina salifodinae]MBP1986554.1 hypothetical protein [Halolamina salifodinae]